MPWQNVGIERKAPAVIAMRSTDQRSSPYSELPQHRSTSVTTMADPWRLNSISATSPTASSGILSRPQRRAMVEECRPLILRCPGGSQRPSTRRALTVTNPSRAAGGCGTVMSPLREAIALEVLLLPRGRVALPGADPDSKATWELLGRTWEADTALGFVRIELAGASWAALVPEERLARNERGVRVTVRRQSSLPQEPLVGWALFC